MSQSAESLTEVMSDRRFRIADYQRPYAWEHRHLADLWSDLDLLGSGDHFTGTLILRRTSVHEDSAPGSSGAVEFEVVDGQQRLTTCVILLDRLRRVLDTMVPLEAAEHSVLVSSLIHTVEGGVSKPRLSLGQGLNEPFAREVLGDAPRDGADASEGRQRLLDAADYFDEQIAELLVGTAEDGLSRLLELSRRVRDQLKFLVYEVEDATEVGVLFETVNDRGRSLTDLEKVKNYLLYLGRQLSSAQRDDLAHRINTSWAEILRNLARSGRDDDVLLRSHWFVTQDASERNWRRTNSVKAKFPRAQYVGASQRLSPDSDLPEHPVGDLYSDVSAYVESLRRTSVFIRDAFDPEAQYADFAPEVAAHVRDRTAAFVRSGSTANFLPLLVAARLVRPGDGDFYLRLVELGERFAARVYVIAAARPNAGRPGLAFAARRLYEGADPEQVLSDIEAILWRYGSDSVVSASLGADRNWYSRAGHKYFLYEYELDGHRKGADLPSFAVVREQRAKTTEHILPQTIDRQRDNDGTLRSGWARDFTPEDHAALVHSIGNLVLTRDNSSYSNKEYGEKRGAVGQSSPCYANESALLREREIAREYEAWTPIEIEARRQSIVGWALRRWPASAPNLDVVLGPEYDDIDDEQASDIEGREVSLDRALAWWQLLTPRERGLWGLWANIAPSEIGARQIAAQLDLPGIRSIPGILSWSDRKGERIGFSVGWSARWEAASGETYYGLRDVDGVTAADYADLIHAARAEVGE